jgi:hypothetical protein
MTHVLIVAGVAAFWVLTLLVKPFGRCFLCRGKGNIVRRGRRRAPRCPLCKGIGRRQRLGSRAVHRVRRRVMAEIRRSRAEHEKRAALCR